MKKDSAVKLCYYHLLFQWLCNWWCENWWRVKLIANHLNVCGSFFLVKRLTRCLLTPLHWQTVGDRACVILEPLIFYSELLCNWNFYVCILWLCTFWIMWLKCAWNCWQVFAAFVVQSRGLLNVNYGITEVIGCNNSSSVSQFYFCLSPTALSTGQCSLTVLITDGEQVCSYSSGSSFKWSPQQFSWWWFIYFFYLVVFG